MLSNIPSPTNSKQALYLFRYLFQTPKASSSRFPCLSRQYATLPTSGFQEPERSPVKVNNETTDESGWLSMDKIDVPRRSEPEDNLLACQFRHDVLAKMMSSPQRKCTLTGALLPRDFLICLRPAFLPSSMELDPTLSDKIKNKIKLDLSSDPLDKPPRSYLIPDKILHPNLNLKPGKGNWMICHRALVQSLIDRKGSHRIFSSIAEVSRLLPLHIEAQLQEKIIMDLQAIGAAGRADDRIKGSQTVLPDQSRSGATKLTSTLSCLVPLSSLEMDRIRTGSNEVQGLLAILDLKGLSTSSVLKQRPHPKTLLDPLNRLIYPTIQLHKLYDDPAEVGGCPERVVPEYPLARILPSWRHTDVLDALAKVQVHGEDDGSKLEYVGVVSTPETIQIGTTDLGIELGKSLWRSRLYSGQGWSGESVDEVEKQESVVVAGFEDRMEGKMHGKLNSKLKRHGR